MTTLIAMVFLTGCSPSEPADEPAVAEAPAEKARQAKARKARSKNRDRRPRDPLMEPVGAPGAVQGTLVLAEASAPAAEPAAEEGEGAAVAGAAKAAAASGEPRTQAVLELSWGEGTEADSTRVELGTVPGTCEEFESEPIGREGHERAPLWAVRCAEGEGDPLRFYVVQIGTMVSVVQEVQPRKPAGEPAPKPRLRPIKRIPLVRGATLERKS